MKSIRVLLLLALVAGATPEAQAATYRCTSGSILQVSARSIGGGGLGHAGCDIPVRCPATHSGACTVKATVVASQPGVISGSVAIGERGSICLDAQTCTATVTSKLGRGKTTKVECHNETPVEFQSSIRCTASVR